MPAIQCLVCGERLKRPDPHGLSRMVAAHFEKGCTPLVPEERDAAGRVDYHIRNFVA